MDLVIYQKSDKRVLTIFMDVKLETSSVMCDGGFTLEYVRDYREHIKDERWNSNFLKKEKNQKRKWKNHIFRQLQKTVLTNI